MAYFLDLFSPETYEAFSKSDRTITGFRISRLNAANKVKTRDKFICYLKLSRWVATLEVIEGPIVAPLAKRERVFKELRSPVFSLLEKGPLAESCTFLSYESVREIAQLPHLSRLSESIIDEDEYIEEAADV